MWTAVDHAPSLYSVFRAISGKLRDAEGRIDARLALVALTVAVPLLLLVLVFIKQSTDQGREAQKQALSYSAKIIASAIDAEIGKYISIAEALSKSPFLAEDDLAQFEIEARRTLSVLPGSAVIVADADGKQLINSAVPPGHPLPVRPADAIDAQRAAAARRAPVISNVFIGPVSRTPVATVELPLYRGQTYYRALAVVMDLSSFQNLLAAQGTPTSWLAGVADAGGRYIARVPDGESLRGELASDGWRAILRKTGSFTLVSREGDQIINYNAVPQLAEWTVGVAIKEAEFNAAAFAVAERAMMWGLLLILTSLGFTIFAVTLPPTGTRS